MARRLNEHRTLVLNRKSESPRKKGKSGQKNELMISNVSRKGTLPWKKKQAEELTNLKTKIGTHQKKLVLA